MRVLGVLGWSECFSKPQLSQRIIPNIPYSEWSPITLYVQEQRVVWHHSPCGCRPWFYSSRGVSVHFDEHAVLWWTIWTPLTTLFWHTEVFVAVHGRCCSSLPMIWHLFYLELVFVYFWVGIRCAEDHCSRLSMLLLYLRFCILLTFLHFTGRFGFLRSVLHPTKNSIFSCWTFCILFNKLLSTQWIVCVCGTWCTLKTIVRLRYMVHANEHCASAVHRAL